jgi:tellurite methyltransferase
MSRADRDKWNARYADGAYRRRPHPSAFLRERLTDLPRGRALDVACGVGRNALYLAEQGYRVDALDISAVALQRGTETARERDLSINWLETDLETDTLPPGPYDLILLVRYVNRPLIAKLAARLANGGRLLCEQHLVTSREVVGPTDAAFRMRPNELLASAAGLRILFYREAIVEDPDGRLAALAQLMACRGEPGF